MKISIGIPVMNQFSETARCLKQIGATTTRIEKIYLVDNGSTPETLSTLHSYNLDSKIINKIVLIRNNKNIGVRPALNQIWKKASEDIIVFTHNDVEFLESDWDKKILDTFEKYYSVGIVGAYGAKRLGTNDIYKSPYKMQQLARGGNVSNCLMDKKTHGFRNLKGEKENVAVFDGFFMAIKKELLDKTEGFSDILPQHHNYDNLISLQSIELGYENIVIPLMFFHKGGQTDVGEEWNKGFGKTKQQIHEESHIPLYEYGKEKLPMFIDDIHDEKGSIIGYELWMNYEKIKTKIY